MRLKILIALTLLSVVGCNGTFINDVKNSSNATTKLVYTGYVGWTNYYQMATNSTTDPAKLANLEQTRLALKAARLDYASSVGILDNWVALYETNAVTKTQVQAALDATLASGSNFIWIYNYIKANGQIQ